MKLCEGLHFLKNGDEFYFIKLPINLNKSINHQYLRSGITYDYQQVVVWIYTLGKNYLLMKNLVINMANNFEVAAFWYDLLIHFQ